MDKGAAVGLVLLDLFTAFETIHQPILFNCLQHWYCIDEVVLKWVQSYLEETVDQNKWTSFRCFSTALRGFPRAQFWGHSFLPYIQSLSVQSYLHYMQMTLKFTLNLILGTSILVSLNWQIALRTFRLGWKIINLNPDTTEFIVIGDDQNRSSLKSSFPVSLLGNIMETAESVKNLGVILDAENSIQRRVANPYRISYYHLRELRRVHRYLNHGTAVKVANALVSSRLDYCNSLLYNTKKAYSGRLHRMPYVVPRAN